MNKARKIIALLGVIVLLALYISTLYFAIFDQSEGALYFKTSVLATIFFPIVLYAMNIFHRMGQKKDINNEKEDC